jgi:hypothetical protein
MGDEGASRRRDDAKSDAEFLADYEAKHGKAAAALVAKSLGMDMPKRLYRNARATGIVGKPRPKSRAPLVPGKAKGGVSWAERHAQFKAEGPPPETAKVVVARRDGECRAEVCEVGDRHIAATSEVVRLYPSQRLVHGVCARTAAVERVRKWERWQAESGGQ